MWAQNTVLIIMETVGTKYRSHYNGDMWAQNTVLVIMETRGQKITFSL